MAANLPKTSFQNLAAEITKTGFVLENRIAQLLKAEKWTVISNRYYVDDQEESIREIDLIAYKTAKVLHFDVFTSLIISCKKSETNLWALLSRAINLKDPNYDWEPVHVWTNDKAINYQVSQPDFAKRYHSDARFAGVGDALKTPEVDVFAFQEMSKSAGAPKDDKNKNIFAAITSLMKAQAYELGALPQRKKTPAVYQFNLLSIVDTDLVRLKFEDGAIYPEEIHSEHYIARYIIKKRETFSRIRFLRAAAVEAVLPEYTALHEANSREFAGELEAFYSGIEKDHNRMRVFYDEFRRTVRVHIRHPFLMKGRNPPDVDEVWLFWNGSSLEVNGDFDEGGVELLNKDAGAKHGVAKALKDIYRYEGPFQFAEDIPF